ncbi:glycosyltransferase family 4 protein [Methylobacterium nigriterrae]|uniref:glycosyltransferase family 4 protein n=1 Tax=Methylobacterium nigriterrae TaxID=3127512 RepID=UPI003013C60B
MTKPRVLIANERFLARFGVDRILILLAEHLAAHGIEVSFACIRCDRAVLERISTRIEQISLPEGIDLLGADASVTRHLLGRFASDPVDVIVSGGWPFFGIAARAGAHGMHSVFIDAGAVPHDGLPAEGVPVQRALRRLRQGTLPTIRSILPISRFIRDSQTEPDRGGDHGVETVLLGADHMTFADAGEAASAEDAATREILDRLDARIADNARLVLALGRVETSGYKNSLAAFDVLRGLRRQVPEAHLLLLVGPEALDLPRDLREHVTTLPTLSDAGLQAVMERCALGLSLSLWEGFNLPIAEMQWLDRPVLAFNIGAHPEVIADPWFLCGSETEMTRKATEILTLGVPPAIGGLHRFERFRERFRWETTLRAWTHAILEPLRPAAAAPPVGRRLVLVDVSNSARDPANSGVIRVTRRLTAELARRGDFDLLYVKWNGEQGTYERLAAANQRFLASNAGPRDWVGVTADALDYREPLENLIRARDPQSVAEPILFLPEVILDGSAAARLRWGQAQGCRAAFVFYDMLPIYEARYVDKAVADAFPSYLAAVRAADAFYAISGFSLSECERWHRDHSQALPDRREAIWLPAQFSDHPRVLTPPARSPEVNILCVSTIEPRKNHRVLIEAFQTLRRRRPDLPVRLNLVGNLYVGAESLAQWVRLAEQADDRIVWHGILSDEEIAAQYAGTSFTVYPSIAEGFGLPIMESLWMGRPCLCHEGGVMAELAADGGCLTVNMNSVPEVAAALEQMVVNPDLREVLTRQVFARRIGTWESYGDVIAARLKEL